MSAFSFNASGQILSITGESLFRSSSYGVTNHRFEVKTSQTISPFASNFSAPNPMTTGSCGFEIYTGTISTYGSPSDNINTLRIVPSSINNCADYLNGISTVDILHIQRHILGIANLNTIIPTADAPYRMISADVNNDLTISASDMTMIQQLILGTRCDFNRPSWAWVNASQVSISSAGFNANPYSFVIPASGTNFANRSRNHIVSNMSNIFTYRATKVGDIVGNGSSGTNSWVCGSGTYFNNNNVSSRSLNKFNNFQLSQGTTLVLSLNIETFDKLLSAELPIFIDGSAFEFIGINGLNSTAAWNYNDKLGNLVISDYDKNLNPIHIGESKYCEIVLKAKRNISSLSEFIYWSQERQVEMINDKLEVADATVSMEIVSKSSHQPKVNWNASKNKVEILSEESVEYNIEIINISGHNIGNKNLILQQGYNEFDLDIPYNKGIYFITFRNTSTVFSQKIIL
jgi:hypothetical protein